MNKIIEFLDRSFHILFNYNNCVKIDCLKCPVTYNHIIRLDRTTIVRSIGCDWYVKIYHE